jgi:DNA-binding SARP family transcriptional activator
MSFYKVLILCLFFILNSRHCVFSQSLGLGFWGYEVHPEKRTALDLSPGKTFCFSENFELSFSLKFRPGLTNYFGYVVRVIANDHDNFDIIYTDLPDTAKNHKQFKLVVGNSYSRIVFEIKHPALFNQWNQIRLKFDFDNSKLILISGREISSQPLRLNRNSCYKFLFGINNYHPFETTDVPSMIIRDIKLFEKNKLKYRWQLDEYEGARSKEDIQEKYAEVKNPLWIKQMHRHWQLMQSITVNGSSNTAFDRTNENLYIISDNNILEDTILKNIIKKYPYKTKQSIIRGSQSVFIPELNKLVNPDVDSGKMICFNLKTRKWSSGLNKPLRFTEHYWHYNKFYLPADSSLYFIGGYGHLKYKNNITRYHFPSKTWRKVDIAHSALTPRYLSALGVTKNGAYIMGGYGSLTGDQALGPQYFYDLLYFDAKTSEIKKIYNFNLPLKDYVFANSMVVNENTRTYYALIFDKSEYNSQLQLITGSLDRPGYKKVGSTIPYFFHDVNSFADLYYCERAKKFVAVILHHNETKNTTAVNIYHLSSPPVAFLQNNDISQRSVLLYMIYWSLIAGLVFIVIVGLKKYYFTQKRALKNPTTNLNHKDEVNLTPHTVALETRNSIFLFGDLQVFDNEGHDLTKLFTPLIKELFLIIVIYSIRWGRGIKSEKLAEYLWPDKTGENARNNRSTNIARLKAILKNLDSCNLSNETGCWKIEFNEHVVMVDYLKYLEIVKSKNRLSKPMIIELADLISRGKFLPDVELEWLDTFKSEITNEVITVYLNYATEMNITDDPEFLILLANSIFDFDPVNEEAMIIKCKALSHLGKHSLAKSAYEKFVRDYKMIYSENFKKDFHGIFEQLS